MYNRIKMKQTKNTGAIWKDVLITLCACLGLAVEINLVTCDTCPFVKDIYHHAVIGAIVNGSAATTTTSICKYVYNLTIIWHHMDTRNTFQVFKSVRNLDEDNAVDMLLMFDSDPQLQTLDQILATSKPLIKWGERTENAAQHSTHRLYLESDMCDVEMDNFVFDDDPDCQLDLNVSTSANDSTADNSVTVTGPLVMAKLVKELQWTTVIILHENATEYEAAELVDTLSGNGVLFVIFNIDLVPDLARFLGDVYAHRDDTAPGINFVVLCRYLCARKIFRAANNFDAQHMDSKSTLLKRLSRWLVAVYGHTHGVSRALQACARDLDNVVIIALPEYNGAGSGDFQDIIEDVLIDIYRQTTDHQNISLVEELVQHITEKADLWTPSKFCKGYKIETLLWQTPGRGFSTVGYVEMSGRVVVLSDLFPNTNYGYNKQKFLISTLPYKPFVMKNIDDNGTATYKGFCMDILREMARNLNFTYTLTEPEDQNWGTIINFVNLTFNGLIGQVQREEVDMVVAPLSTQASRERVVDFTHPFYYDYTTVLTKKPDPKLRKWRTLIDPFKPEVLASIGVALPVMTLLIFLLEKYNPYYEIPENAEERKRNGGLDSLVDAFWYMYGALLNQGGVHLPASVTGRTFISCWCLFSIILVGTYSGNLIAFLTVTKDKPLFSTLEEMVSLGGDFKWGTLSGTSWETVFMTSNKSVFRKIGDGLIEFNRTDPGVMNKDPKYHLQRIKESSGDYAWIGDKTFIEYAMSTECGLLKIKDEFLPLKYAIVFPNNSPHTKIFSDQLMIIRESGLLQLWKRRWWPKSNFCGGDMVMEAKAITVIDVQSAFYVCLIGVALGTISFICEVLVFQYIQYWRRKNPKLDHNVVVYTRRQSTFLGITAPAQDDHTAAHAQQDDSHSGLNQSEAADTNTLQVSGSFINGGERIPQRKNVNNKSLNVDPHRQHERVYY